MLLPLIWAWLPPPAAAGDVELPVLSTAGEGSPRAGQPPEQRWVLVASPPSQPLLPARLCPGAASQHCPPMLSSLHSAKPASAMQILISPGRAEAATAWTVQPGNPGDCNLWRDLLLSQQSREHISRAKFPPQLQGTPTREVTQRKAEGAEMHSTDRYTITAVPCCGFVKKHHIFGEVRLGRGRPKLTARENPSQTPTTAISTASVPSPSPFPMGKPTPGACNLKKIIARL